VYGLEGWSSGWILVLGFGFWVLGLGFWVLGFGFGFWVLGFGVWVLGFGFWVTGAAVFAGAALRRRRFFRVNISPRNTTYTKITGHISPSITPYTKITGVYVYESTYTKITGAAILAGEASRTWRFFRPYP
jgi:hypothetical protein